MKRLILVRLHDSLGIGPKLFKFIVASCRFQEHMDDDIHEVYQNPFRIVTTLYMVRFAVRLFKDQFLHLVGDGIHLCLGGRVADDEIIRHGSGDLPQVEGDDVLAFHGFHGLDGRGHDFFLIIVLMSNSHISIDCGTARLRDRGLTPFSLKASWRRNIRHLPSAKTYPHRLGDCGSSPQ